VSDEAAGFLPIRPLRTMDEYRACVALQEKVWGEGFSERVPPAILMVSQRLGGVLAGAWDEEGELAGFVFGMTGWKGGEPFHWSDMLAVRPGLRGSGLGLRLKAYQREALLEAGVGVAHWTFDPLESRNAWVNLGRLGAVAREYVEDMYGQTDSPLHRGIGTDRLVVTWELASPRVAARMDRGDAPPGPEALEEVPRALEVREQEGCLRPLGGSASGDARKVRVPIPPDLQALKDRNPELAREWRLAVREALAPRLARGWEVRELVRHGNVSEYLVVLKED
jgi:predicted GNAT superfamily acetyltransferase